MATTVIIPARNEARTVGAIVQCFNQCRETAGHVYVGLDADNNDDSDLEIRRNGGYAIQTDQRGKGQVVGATMQFLKPYTPRIILCDADYYGMTKEHVIGILSHRGMVIGVPDWPETEVPSHVINAWPQVSGFRSLPWDMLRNIAEPRGYLLETQLNIAAVNNRIPVRHVFMTGLKSPFQWPLSTQRHTELVRDQIWGREHGIF